MRTMLLMAVFSLGAALLLPQPARSIAECEPCKCHVTRAWQNVNPNEPGTFGLRDVDPANKEMTIPIDHVPQVSPEGRLLAAKDAGGKQKSQGIQLSVYKYNNMPDLECQVAIGENGFSKVIVTYTKQADWNNCSKTGNTAWWYICVPDDGGGDS